MNLYNEWLGEEYRHLSLIKKLKFWLASIAVVIILPFLFIFAIIVLGWRLVKEVMK
jgi:hypothetical protein